MMYELFTKGGPLMWPLLACSFVSITVCLERLIWGQRQKVIGDLTLARQIIGLVKQGHLDRARQRAMDSRCPICCVLREGLHHSASIMGQAMQLAGDEHIKKDKRGLAVLDTIITVAPLLGILGTVLGIIDSFDLLSDAGLQNPQAVLGGIAQALITTAAGLSVAVVSLIPFNYFITRVQKQADQLTRFATLLELAVCSKSESNHAD